MYTAHDFLGRGGGHFLDVHAAGGARHHDGLAGRAIEHEAQVQLARHLQAFFDQDTAHDAAVGPGLVCHERHAEHVARDAFGIVGRACELHPAAFAAAPGVNLRLDDDHAAAQTVRDLARVGGGGRHFPARDGNTVAFEDGFGLVLVNFHAGKRLIVIRGRADRQSRGCQNESRTVRVR